MTAKDGFRPSFLLPGILVLSGEPLDVVQRAEWLRTENRIWHGAVACAVSRQVRGLEGVDDRRSGLPMPRGEQAPDRPGWRVAVLVTFVTRVYPRINERCA